MTNQQLETFLFQYTESEQRHLREQPPQLSPRYRNIPKVVYNGREMYQFNFGSLLKNRSVCVNKESRFTVIPEHIHSVIEFLYVYSGHCTQIINGQSIHDGARRYLYAGYSCPPQHPAPGQKRYRHYD